MSENVTQKDKISTEFGVDEEESSLTESQKEDATNGISISRPIYNKANFLLRYNHDQNQDIDFSEKVRNLKPDISCNRVLNVILSFVPLLTWLPKYKIRRDLPSDIAGGLTVGVMNIPQGLAYALLASLPPIVGLYTSLIPVLVYFVFGTSRHIAIGTFAIISTMVGEVCEEKFPKYYSAPSSNSSLNQTSDSPWSPEDDAKLRIAVSLTLLVGVIQAAMGLVHLGFVTVYLSRPLVSGFTTGAAFIVFTSQVKYFFGITPPRYAGELALPKTYIYLFKNIADTNVAALLTGLICVILLVGIDNINNRFKARLRYPIPSQLLVIIIGAAVSHIAKLNERYGVSVIDSIPKGLPKFRAPEQRYFVDLILDAFLIALVAATTNLSLVKLFSQKHEYKTDSNQDLLAYGCANVISSFFSCFVSSGSLSRSVVQDSIGKTQIASFVSSIVILLVLLFMSPLFEPLPKPVLAAIVVVSLRRLFLQFKQLKTIGKISNVDAIIWFISCFAVVFLGIVMGLIAGFAVTLLSIIYRASKGHIKILGHLYKTEFYKDSQICLDAKSIPGLQVVQFKGPLIFVNAEHLLDSILTIVRENSPHHKKDDDEDTARVAIDSDQQDALPGNFVEGVVSEGDKRITLKMVRSLNPMSAVVSFDNMGSDDFTEEVTGNEPDGVCGFSSSQTTTADTPDEQFRGVIIDFSSVTIVDFVGIVCLRQIIEKSQEMGVNIYLSGCSYYMYRHMSRDDFLAEYINENSFLSIHDAVLYSTRKSRLQSANSDLPTSSEIDSKKSTSSDPAVSNERNEGETLASVDDQGQ